MPAETTEWAGPTRFLPPTEPTKRDDGALHYSGLTYAVAFGYRPLQLDLWVPAGDGPAPVVVWVHGGGFMFGDRRGRAPPVPPHHGVDRRAVAGRPGRPHDHPH